MIAMAKFDVVTVVKEFRNGGSQWKSICKHVSTSTLKLVYDREIVK
jgi:hypothetical protein